MLLLTPTHPGDYARLQLLLRSLRHFDVDADHLVVVADADLRSAAAALAGERITLLPQSALLPRSTDALRALPPPAARAVKVGWWRQQWVKLCAGRALGLDSWVCLDSDTFLLGRLEPGHVQAADGRPLLLELLDHPVGPHVERYNRRSARLLGLPASVGGVDRVYTGQAVPVSGRVANELLSWVSRHHAGRPWWLTMALAQATEYSVYGQYARHRHLADHDEASAAVVPSSRYLSVDVYRPVPPGELCDELVRGRDAGRPLGMVHSHLGYDLAQVEAVLREVWRTA